MRRKDRFWTRCRREKGPQTRTVLGSCDVDLPLVEGGSVHRATARNESFWFDIGTRSVGHSSRGIDLASKLVFGLINAAYM